MTKIEEMLRVTSPKLVLDNYWNVLGLLEWRLLREGQPQEKNLTISDVTGFLSKELKKEGSPFYQRLCSRSMTVVENVVDELENSGLLIRENDSFQKSDKYSEFYRILKKAIKTSVKRYVAWTVWHLYHKGLTSFSASEILRMLSYPDEECLSEIPHLSIWKRDSRRKLLRRHGDVWTLSEEPYLLTKSILLLDLNRRLYVAISELSKTRSRFRADEIVSELRRLETASIESILRKTELKNEQGKWHINDVALEGVKYTLQETRAEKWPFFGVLISKDPHFRLQSRTLYADMPNTTVWNFVNELGRISYERKGDKERMLEEAKELATAFNQNLEKSLGEWMVFVIRKQYFGSKPFGVQIRIDWSKFFLFLDTFAQNELPLWNKYSYILNCRAPSLTLVLRGDLERVQQSVREICKEEMDQINRNIENLVSRINEAKDYLFKITSHRRTIPVEPSTLEYFPEMMSTLRALVSLLENGTIPACYREMRKVLENLAWVIFDDLLFYKAVNVSRRKRVKAESIMPYRAVSKEWYDWASQEKLMITNLTQLKKKIRNLTEAIYLHGENKAYDWNKKQIEETLFKRLSYPLFLLLTGIDIQVPRKLEDILPRYETKILKDLAAEDLKNIMKELRHGHLTRSDETFAEKLTKILEIKESSKIVPPYPSNEFVLGFVSKVLSGDLVKSYKEYSHFVHSYFTSWHIFPFSSVLEFRIFNHEFSVFADIIQQLIDTYLKELFIRA